ncbi:MAG TPA: BMP family ABC transporter substrate-binding protein, partial [Fimbriimonadaceae bacterium]|nr:BMP family ABC transporter substrate-binding protein [Fimbriimonadaceae bacterium]
MSGSASVVVRWAFLAAAALTVASCGGPSSEGGSAAGTGGQDVLDVGVVFDSGGRGDQSFNDSAWRGIERAKEELGIRESSIESENENAYERNIAAMAEQ